MDDKNKLGKLVVESIAQLVQAQNRLLENNNPIKFNYPFTGNHYETLPWIFAAEKYLRVNTFTTPKIKFQRIFSSMNENYQNRYLIDTEKDPQNLSFDKLKTWVLKEYPPPKTKYEFKLKLKAMLTYKNEDPNVAYSRFKYKLARINKAIETINEGLKAQSDALHPNDEEKAKQHFKDTKLYPVSVEDKREALTRMFIIRNNSPRFNNVGKVNDRVVKYLLAEDPRQMKDWDKCFNDMKQKLIPRLLDGQKEYEYIHYPIDKNDDTIYVKKHHQTKTPNHPNVPRPKPRNPHGKRGRDSDNNPKGPPKKRLKTITCTRCYRRGHHVKQCFADKDANGNLLKSPAPKQQPQSPKGSCTICGKTNHPTRKCYFKDKPKTVQCHNCGKYGHISRNCRSSRDDNRKNKNGFTKYGSSNNQQHDSNSNEPEVNVMNKPEDVSSAIDMIEQWSRNTNMNDSTREDLLKFMNEIKSSPRNSQ